MRRAVNKKSQRKRAKPTHRRDGWSIAPPGASHSVKRQMAKDPRIAGELQFDPWYPKPGELAAARKYHGLSQFKAAEAMDIPLMRLSMLEASLAKVTEDEGFAIFWLYGVHDPHGAIID